MELNACIRNGVLYYNGATEVQKNDTTTIGKEPEPLNQDDMQSQLKARPWQRVTTEIFVNECVKRKIDLRDPFVRRSKIFSEIRLQMLDKGYDFDERSLKKKFANLRTRFLLVKNNNNKNTKGEISWPYFEQMSIIFPTNITRDVRTESSSRSTASASRILAPRAHRSLKTSNNLSNRPERRPRKNRETPNKLEALRNQLLALEERRTVAIEAIAAELHETNRISLLKFELEKKMFENKVGEED